jgi:hypothetical protein
MNNFSPEFGQIVKGNVTIIKLSKYRYRITFSKIGKIIVYQFWDKDNLDKINNKRVLINVSAKKWIKAFKTYNEKLEEIDEPLFTPTTIMETPDDDAYAFIIHKVCFDSNDRVVFIVSTEEISLQNNTLKKMIQLPCRKFDNMRFDIESISSAHWSALVDDSLVAADEGDGVGLGGNWFGYYRED